MFISLHCYLTDHAAALENDHTGAQATGDNSSNVQETAAAKPEGKPGIIRRMKTWMESWAYSDYALLALFILAFAESSFFPIPPDVLLIALCISSPPRAFLFALACSAASVAGGIFGYVLGRLLYDPVVKPVSRFIRLDKYLDSALEYYKKYDVWAVGIAGFTPIPYKVFTIAGGLARLNVIKFIIASAVSRSARFFIVATLLYFLGNVANEFIDKYFDWLALAFGALLIGSFVVVAVFFKKKGKADEDAPKSAEAPRDTSTADERGSESGEAQS